MMETPCDLHYTNITVIFLLVTIVNVRLCMSLAIKLYVFCLYIYFGLCILSQIIIRFSGGHR